MGGGRGVDWRTLDTLRATRAQVRVLQKRPFSLRSRFKERGRYAFILVFRPSTGHSHYHLLVEIANQ